MSDLVKDLVDRLMDGNGTGWPSDLEMEAADYLRSQADEIERLREALTPSGSTVSTIRDMTEDECKASLQREATNSP